MKTLHLMRSRSAPDGTAGKLTGMDVDFYSLEKPWADNRTGESCIPAGSYLCTFGHSDHFAKIYPEGDGRCYHVENVPNRTSILIHNANRQEQLQGCIAIGLDAGVMPDSMGKAVKAVLRSKSAIREFHKTMAGEPFQLIITDWSPSND